MQMEDGKFIQITGLLRCPLSQQSTQPGPTLGSPAAGLLGDQEGGASITPTEALPATHSWFRCPHAPCLCAP